MARRPNVIGNGAKLMGAAGSGAPVVFLSRGLVVSKSQKFVIYPKEIIVIIIGLSCR